jgi:hypothetical protein
MYERCWHQEPEERPEMAEVAKELGMMMKNRKIPVKKSGSSSSDTKRNRSSSIRM